MKSLGHNKDHLFDITEHRSVTTELFRQTFQVYVMLCQFWRQSAFGLRFSGDKVLFLGKTI